MDLWKRRLKEMEAEMHRDRGDAEKQQRQEPAQASRRERPLKRRTKNGVLLGVAMVVAFLLIWKKINIHFFGYINFWQLLILLGVIFLGVFLVLRYFFGTTEKDPS